MHPNYARLKLIFPNEKKSNKKPETLRQFFISKIATTKGMRISFTTGEEGMERNKS